jgi:hypothetical protein
MSQPKPPPGFEIVGDVPPPPEGFEIQGATLGQKAQASLPGRVYKGIKDPVDAMAQLAPRALERLTRSGGLFSPVLDLVGLDTSNPVSRFMASEAKRVDSMVAGDEKEYQESRKAVGQEGFDGGRLVGNIVSPANVVPARVVGPLKQAPTVANLLRYGAKAGAVAAPLTSPVTDERSQENFGQAKSMQTGLGAVTGGVLTPVLGKAAEAIVRHVDAARRSGSQGAQVDEIIERALREVEASKADIEPQMLVQIRAQVDDALRTGKKLDAAALFRQREFKEVGIEPMLGQITRDPTQFANERNLRGADPRVAARLNEQSRKLAESLRVYGAKSADEPQVVGGRLIDTLAGIDKRAGKEVSDAYGAARQAAGRDMEIPLQGIAQDVERISADYGTALPSAVRERLASYGLLGGKQTKIFTQNDAEQVLQQINKLRGSDKATNNALSEVASAVKRAITGADDTGGVFAKPREMAAMRFKMQDMVPALKAAADGDASADRFVSQFVLRGETGEVKKLAVLLKGTNPDMYDQVRSQFGAELMRAAYGENVAGDKVVRPEALSKAIRQFGTERLSAFFSPAEIAQMQRLSRVSAYMESVPAGSPVNTSNSLTAALPFLTRLPVVGEGVRIADALRRIGQQERTATRGLAAAVPQSSADLSPEAARTLAKLLAAGGVGSGVLGAEAVR